MRSLSVSLICILAHGAMAAWPQSSPVVLHSPDGRLAISFHTETEGEPAPEGGRLVYSVSFQDQPLIEPSALRLELEGQGPLGSDVRIVNAARSQTDETYRLVTGKVSVARDHHNGLHLELEENGDAGRRILIEARAFDDAVAFRYLVPEQPSLSEFRLVKEGTEFRFTKDATTYALALPHFETSYEREFLKLPVSAFTTRRGDMRNQVLLGLPMLLEVPGVAWMAILEADLRDYAAMYLVNPATTSSGRWFEARLSPQLDHTELCVTGPLPRHSAWRVLLVAPDPGRFIESTTLTSLNPPSAIMDTSWIRAGRASWNWWSGSIGPDGTSAYTTETMKYYVDFAARSGFEYMLIDAGWSARDDITTMNGRVNIPEVVQYAASKDVQVWIWIHYRTTTRQMDEAFPLFAKWGVAGVKIDFVERDDQEGIAFYYRAAAKAAEHRLMVDFHGSTKPWGLERTYPNVLGYEAVIGMERSRTGTRDDPGLRVMLPFTRMLAGQMDYTPGGFDNVTREEFEGRPRHPMVMGTRAHHLAMYVVYESPFQMVSDKPSAYDGQPSFQFIQDVPATWDETRVLNGVPGEYITIARRHADEWFLGSMSNWKPRELEVPLTFLGSGEYMAEIYADAKDADRFPRHTVIEKKRARNTTSLKIQLAPAGGYAARFQRVR